MIEKVISLMLVCTLIVTLFGMGIRKVQADSETEAPDATVIIDTDSAVVDEYRGVGVQWDPIDDVFPSYTAEEWDMVTERFSFARFPFIRCMINATDYCRAIDAEGNAEYDFESDNMQRLYQILDYCEANNVEVMFGEWSKPKRLGITSSADPRWAKIIADLMVYLLDVKGYTCIKFYNYINEPNGNWPGASLYDEEGDKFIIWRTGIKNLHKEFTAKTLGDSSKIIDHVTIVGPDNTGNDEWVNYAVDQLSNIISHYETHRYASKSDITANRIEQLAYEKRRYIDKYDDNGISKEYWMSEAGMVEGKLEAYDCQMLVEDFVYGVLMADYTIQTMRGGQAGIIYWMLDDIMHAAPGNDPVNFPYKQWGFWTSRPITRVYNGETQVQTDDLRPWYYPVSLLSRNIPRGSKIVYASPSNVPNLNITAATFKDGNRDHLTIAVVNDSQDNTPRKTRLIVPSARTPVNLDMYVYFDDNRPTDENGYPVKWKTLENVILSEGIDIDMPGSGFVLLTTKDNGTGITLTPSNLARGKTASASTVQLTSRYPYPEKAVDGNTGTHWRANVRTDIEQWLKVDLGSEMLFNRVKIDWNEGYATSYKIQISNDGVVWEDVYENTMGKGRTEDIVFTDDPEEARYVRVLLLKKSTGSYDGYTINEFEVYHVPNAPVTKEEALPNYLRDDCDNFDKVHKYDMDTIDTGDVYNKFNGDAGRFKRWSDQYKYVIYYLPNIETFRARIYVDKGSDGLTDILLDDGSVYVYNGKPVVDFLVSSDEVNWQRLEVVHTEKVYSQDPDWYHVDFSPAEKIPPGYHYLRIDFNPMGIPGIDRGWTPQLSEIEIWAAEKEPVVNLAERKEIMASSGENAGYAVDGDIETGWTTSEENAWIYVNLGKDAIVNKVVLNWGEDFAIDYTVEVSDDAENWTRIGAQTNGNGKKDSVIPVEPVKARYVKLTVNRSSNAAGGYILKEFQVMGSYLSAADVAASITSIASPEKGASQILLPQVPEGFRIEIYSSSAPDIISGSGDITTPEYDTVVKLILKVTRISDGKYAYTGAIPVLVPGTKQVSDKPFTIQAAGGLDRSAGIKATAKFSAAPGHDIPEGAKVVAFRLMKGDRIVRTHTCTANITPGQEMSVYFNIHDPDRNYSVRVFVFDTDMTPLADSIVIN